jgi:hypothetical protein
MEILLDFTKQEYEYISFPVIDSSDRPNYKSGIGGSSGVKIYKTFYNTNISGWQTIIIVSSTSARISRWGTDGLMTFHDKPACSDLVDANFYVDLTRPVTYKVTEDSLLFDPQTIVVRHRLDVDISTLATEANATSNAAALDAHLDTQDTNILALDAHLDLQDGTGFNTDTDSLASVSATLDGIGGGVGGGLNFAVEDDNVLGVLNGVTFVGTQTPGTTFANLKAEDGVYQVITSVTSVIDIVYKVNIGSGRSASELNLKGYLSGVGDTATISVWNGNGSTWDTKGTFTGKSGAVNDTKDLKLLLENTGTGAELGIVYVRIQSSDTTVLYLDMALVAGVNIGQTVGYANGAIWYDENGDTNANTVPFVDGTADNPVTTWAAVIALNAVLKLNRINIANGSSVTITASIATWELVGEGWDLILNNQNVEGSFIHGACITGISSGGTVRPTLENCCFGAASLPASEMRTCGFGVDSGTFTAASNGQFTFVDCYSRVAGSGIPSFDFSALTATSGVNNRGWKGGSYYTLNSFCVLSHEVLVGGGTFIETGGANCEIRGMTRNIEIIMSAAETVQFVGTTGPITLGGTTTGTVNLYGISSEVIDTTVTATVNNNTVSSSEVNLIDTNVTTIDTKVDAQDLVLEEIQAVTANDFVYNESTGRFTFYAVNGTDIVLQVDMYKDNVNAQTRTRV